MTLRRFLNVAYAILVEEYQRRGSDLITALDEMAEYAEGGKPKPEEQPSAKVAAQNQAAYQQLGMMMAGVKGKKPMMGGSG